MKRDNGLDLKTTKPSLNTFTKPWGKKAGVMVEGFGSSCKINGKSNTSYQIDVLTSHSKKGKYLSNRDRVEILE